MTDKSVIDAENISFGEVAWGRSKIIVSPAANGSEHVRVGMTEYHPGSPHEPHSHPGQEEVIWVLSGRGYTEGGGERQPLYPGALAYIPAGMAHKTAAEGAPMTAIIIKGPARDAGGKVS